MRFLCGSYSLSLTQPLVMGIVNVTPDSFFDGGNYQHSDQAIAHGLRLIEQGADILDIGGESSRPLAQPISQQEEMDRVIPVVEGLVKAGIPLSLDSRRPEVMRSGVSAGISLINDVSALETEGAVDVIAHSQVGVCLTHRRGTPETMDVLAHYRDVVTEVSVFLTERAQELVRAGVSRERIVLDPGIGFAKKFAHNLNLMRSIHSLKNAGYPVAIGVSRKRFIGDLLGNKSVGGRLMGSVMAAVWAINEGASLIRVHDVEATVEALKVWRELSGTNDG